MNVPYTFSGQRSARPPKKFLLVDEDFQNALEGGQRNFAGFKLVRNWCSHVRIEKFGGTGIVEQMSGLPIGNHGLKCDHAPLGGMYTWDIREAALDFYDRHCVDCKMRKPVAVPNLLKWVKERDDARAAQERQAETDRLRQQREREARRAARTQLREGLDALSAALIDHLDEFDDNRDREHRDRLCESARMAPEHFAPPVIAHIFDLTEREPWFTEAGLTVLDHLKADPARLAALALAALKTTWPIETPARILTDRVALVDAEKIANVLPPIIELAFPSDDFFPGPRRPVAPEPELLRVLWATHPTAVRKGLTALFASRRYYDIELAARGLVALAETDSLVFGFFHRTMVATFTRASLVLDDFDENHKSFRHLRDAVVAAFGLAPEAIDALVQEYISASDKSSRDRAYKIYEAACRGRRSDGPPLPADSSVHRISFQRLLWATTDDQNGDEILRCALDVFHTRPYELINIARAELDNLLGAALLLDDRLHRHDDASPPDEKSFLLHLVRRNQRMTITSLIGGLVEWASAAAKDDPALIKKVVDMFDRVPDGRDYLKGLVLGSLEHLGTTVEGLKLVLPHIYYGLVGPSVVVRSYAAKALRDAPHENIPPLVYEAFSALLLDRYVMVHKAAVDALDFFELPKSVRGRSAQALLQLVKCYAQTPNEDDFLIRCVRKLAYELRHLGKEKGNVGQYLVKVLLAAQPLYLRNEISSLARALGETEGFIDVVIKLTPHIDDRSTYRDDELEILAKLPKDVILSRKQELANLGMQLAPTRPWLAVHLIDILTRVGAQAEAVKIAEAGANLSPPNPYNEAIRLSMNGVRLALAFEDAVASPHIEALKDVSEHWDKDVKDQREFKADVARRNSRSSFSHTF